MKRIILFVLCLSVISSATIAQNYTVSPNPVSASADLDNPNTHPDDVEAHAGISNNTSDTLFMRWERVYNDKPDSWETAVCDVNLCYFPHVSTKDFILTPNLQNGDMIVHAYPGMEPGGIPENGAVPGEATVHIKLSNLNDPTDTLIVVYNFTVTGEAIVSISEVELEAIKIYPNPASDYFQLTETQEIQQLVIYNVLGRIVETFEVNSGQRYDISNLADGIYLVGMVDRDQQTVKTIRLQKH